MSVEHYWEDFVLRFLACLWLGLGSVSIAAPIQLKEDEVIAFVGGTDLVRMQKDGFLEGCLTQRHLDRKPRFRDLAWDGDTVYFQSTVGARWRKEAFGDWQGQLQRIGATMVIAQFGKIESIDGVEKIDEFKKAYGKLLKEFAAEGRRVVVLAPSPFDKAWAGAPEGAAFAEYSRAVEEVAEEQRVVYIGHGEVEVDLGWPGHSFVQQLADGERLRGGMWEAVAEKHRLWYDYWRPANWKCLYGDDGKRVFSNASEGLPSFKDEWSTFPALIAAAEERIFSGKPVGPQQATGLTGSAEADVAGELAAFEVLDGYEVNLFADESLGVSNPLSLRWDPDRRMYVACSDVYPQIEPGVRPNDRIISLLDTDGDGRADESALFAEGLNIPTGMEVGPEGIYVGQNTELLLLDWEGRRRVLLSGFGNGDSHQTINSFVWGPGGDLWFCQGDGIESRVETPFGVSSLYQAGVFRLRPGELKLDGLLDDFMGPGNPWGVAFDDFGQSFVVDGAGGISYLTPASIPAKRRLKLPQIGKPGGYCGVECVGDGEFLVGDYKKNQVSRFEVVEDGAGFKVEFQAPLLRSKHRNFRPIDVKLGPDGAIYIVDWYNPITCHQDDFYRHPNRDKTHGRIWRVAKKDAVVEDSPPLLRAGVFELVERLRSDNRWIRQKAKQVLVSQGLTEVPAKVLRWEGRDLFEAVSLAEMLGSRDEDLLRRLAGSEDHRARAYAARVAGKWGLVAELEAAANDPHPLVRMEAVLACGQIPEARSVLIAAAAAEHARDRWIDYAFKQAVHHLKPHWVPAFKRGELDFGDRTRGLAAVLAEADSEALLGDLRELFKEGELEHAARVALAKSLVAVGGERDLELVLQFLPAEPSVLVALAKRDRPGGDLVVKALEGALREKDSQVAALELIRSWRVEELREATMLALASAPMGSELRRAAIGAYSRVGEKERVLEFLMQSATLQDSTEIAVMEALVEFDPAGAAKFAVRELGRAEDSDVVQEIFAVFVERDGAANLLAAELAKAKLAAAKGRFLYEQWIASGLVDHDLSARLDVLGGTGSGNRYVFTAELVAKIAAEGRVGDRAKGKELFASARLGCLACHCAGSEGGGVIGPDLSAVGSGVALDRIVIEVLWPRKQVKEGYSLSRVTSKDGSVLQGYEQKSRDESKLLLRDFATGEMHELKRDGVAKKDAVGSLMPASAQVLSEGELEDLFAYLFSLRGE